MSIGGDRTTFVSSSKDAGGLKSLLNCAGLPTLLKSLLDERALEFLLEYAENNGDRGGELRGGELDAESVDLFCAYTPLTLTDPTGDTVTLFVAPVPLLNRSMR